MIYFDRIEVVNMLVPSAGKTLLPCCDVFPSETEGRGLLTGVVEDIYRF